MVEEGTSQEINTPEGNKGKSPDLAGPSVREIFATGEGKPTGEVYRPTADEINRRNGRSIMIALGVAGFIVLVYLITILRLGQAVSNGVYPGS